MKTLGVIPARYGSTRFLGKPLVPIAGKPMIQHVYERCIKSSLNEVIVATDDQRIFNLVRSFGGHVVMTAACHLNGTSRVAEVAKTMHWAEIVVNIQGDEPLIDPALINLVTRACKDHAVMASVRKKITNKHDIFDPNCVKVVCNNKDEAIYFSRAPIPFNRIDTSKGAYKHIGLYAYSRDFLHTFVSLPRTPLEEQEDLEQLRVIESGHTIRMVETTAELRGVDTPHDVIHVEKILEAMV